MAPGVLSVTLSEEGGSEEPTPLPFASKAACGLTYKYSKYHDTSTAVEANNSCDELSNEKANFALLNSIAASSAFVGTINRETLISWVNEQFLGGLLPDALLYPLEKVLAGLGEDVAQLASGLSTMLSDLPSEQAFDPLPDDIDEALAKAKTSTPRSLADAAMVDNSGIGLQLAAGAKKIVYLNWGVEGDLFADLDKVCADYDKDSQTKAMYALLDIPASEFRDKVTETSKKLEAHGCDPREFLGTSNQIYNGIHYGSMTVTTLRNDWWGVEAGREVEISWVLAEIEIPKDTINLGGLLTNFDTYSKMEACLVTTLSSKENAPTVRSEILQKMLNVPPPATPPPPPKMPGYCDGKMLVDDSACDQANNDYTKCITMANPMTKVLQCDWKSEEPPPEIPGTCEGATIVDKDCGSKDQGSCLSSKNFVKVNNCHWVPSQQ